MKGLIILIIASSYAMGIIIESSSHYVPSGEKSKPTPMPIMTPPAIQVGPIQQLQNDVRKDYVQATIDDDNNDGNEAIKQNIPIPTPNQNTEQVRQNTYNNDYVQNDDSDVIQMRPKPKRIMRKTIPY